VVGLFDECDCRCAAVGPSVANGNAVRRGTSVAGSYLYSVFVARDELGCSNQSVNE